MLVLFAAGDVLAQTVTMDKGGEYNWSRTARAAVFGSLLLGPLAHTHFNFIEWLVVKKVTNSPPNSSDIHSNFTSVSLSLCSSLLSLVQKWLCQRCSLTNSRTGLLESTLSTSSGTYTPPAFASSRERGRVSQDFSQCVFYSVFP